MIEELVAGWFVAAGLMTVKSHLKSPLFGAHKLITFSTQSEWAKSLCFSRAPSQPALPLPREWKDLFSHWIGFNQFIHHLIAKNSWSQSAALDTAVGHLLYNFIHILLLLSPFSWLHAQRNAITAPFSDAIDDDPRTFRRSLQSSKTRQRRSRSSVFTRKGTI